METELKQYSKIIGKLIILSFALIAFDWLVYPQIISIAYRNLEANRYCFEKQADIIVLGDSHTQRSINPNFSNTFEVYNFSKTGNYFPMSYAIYSTYREHNPAPKYVVLSMEPWSFKDKPFLGNYFLVSDKSHGTQYIRESMVDVNTYSEKVKRLKLNIVEHASFTTDFLLRLAIKTLFSHKVECLNGKSYVLDRNPANRNNNVSKIKRPAKFKIVEYDNNHSPFSKENQINFQYFKKLVDKFAQDNVQVILLESPRFIGASESLANLSKFYQDIENIIRDFENIVFLKNDFFDIDHDDPFIFYDGSWGNPNSHLNGKGAEIFNEQFFNWLKSQPFNK